MALTPPAQAMPLAAARPAAAGSILGNVSEVAKVAGEIRSAIAAFASFSGATHAPPTLIQQIQALIAQSQAEIVQQIDATATATVLGQCDQVAAGFQDFTKPDHAANLENYVSQAVLCVTTSSRLVGAETNLAAVDADSLALNAGGVMALTAEAFAGDHTDVVINSIIQGDEQLLTKLKPSCGTTPDDDVSTVMDTIKATEGIIPGTGGQAPINGHDACYAYSVTPPTPIDGHIVIFPTGPGTGTQPWHVTGDGEAEISGGIFISGYHVNWPAQSDFSIAARQAVAGTSVPIAQATLGQLLPDASPFAAPVSIVTPPPGSQIATPIPVFQVDGAGTLERGTVTPRDNLGDVAFSGWSRDTASDTPNLKAVTSAVNADGRYQVFGLDRVGRLFTQWQEKPGDDSTWSPWAQLDGPSNGLFGSLNSVTVARNQNGALQIFANDTNGISYTRTEVLNGDFADRYKENNNPPPIDDWTPWQTMDGRTVALSAVTDSQNRIELFGTDSIGQLFERQENAQNDSDYSVAGNWTSWVEKTGPTTVALRTISATTDLGGVVNVFGTDDNGRVFQSTTGAWDQVPGSVHFMSVAKGGGGAGRMYLIGQDAAGDLTLNDNDGIGTDAWSGQFCGLNAVRTCTTHEAPYVAYQTFGKTLGTMTPDGLTHDSGAAMMAGTSPSITTDFASATTRIAYVGSDGFLYTQQQGSAPVKLGGGLAVAPGTSPAVASNGAGFWEIVYARPGDRLATIDSDGGQTTLDGVLAAGTGSPAITFVSPHRENDPNGGFWVAFDNNSDHLLWTINPANHAVRAGGGLSVVNNTSPSIATNGNDSWAIAFAGPGGVMTTVDTAGNVTNTGMAVSSSPSITFVPNLGYLTAFRGSDGTLWTSGPTGTSSLGSGAGFAIAPGTSPSIAADAVGDWEVAFHGGLNDLRTVSSQGDHVATVGNSLGTGLTSPAIVIPAR